MKQQFSDPVQRRRNLVMLFGILCIGIAVGFYRLGCLGVDAGTCMVLGISFLAGMTHGTMNVIVNVLILLVMVCYMRRIIGAGTIINFLLVGYIADFVCWFIQEICSVGDDLWIRLIWFGIAICLSTFGAAIYIDADKGIAPYDALSLMLQKKCPKLSFRFARVIVDVTSVMIGVACCLLAGRNLSLVIGLGTVVTAFLTGYIVHFFRQNVSPLFLPFLKTKP